MKNLIYCEEWTIYSAYLPWVTVGINVTIEPLKNDEKFAGTCVLLVKEYGVLDSLSIWNGNKMISNIWCVR